MYKNKKIIAIIPARGGSKGIPHKNIIKINNRPLIQYTIDAAKRSKYIDEIIVSTDDEEIANICRILGVNVPFLRPYSLSLDHSKTIDAILYTIKRLQDNEYTFNYVMVLQPTQPLRQTWHIDESIEKIVEENGESLVSVCEVREHPILMRTINKNGQLENLLSIGSTVRRQDFPKTYKVNGAIYINDIKTLNEKTSLNDNVSPYIMALKYDLDIDEEKDLLLFRKKLKMDLQ